MNHCADCLKRHKQFLRDLINDLEQPANQFMIDYLRPELEKLVQIYEKTSKPNSKQGFYTDSELADIQANSDTFPEPFTIKDDNSIRIPGKICSVCNEPQFMTPSGICCKNGHGGAPAK